MTRPAGPPDPSAPHWAAPQPVGYAPPPPPPAVWPGHPVGQPPPARPARPARSTPNSADRLDRMFRLWRAPAGPLSPALLAAAVASGVLGSVALGDGVLRGVIGLNVLIAALACVAAVLPVAWASGRVVHKGRMNRTGAVFIMLGLALTGTAALRDAPWMVALCLTLAAPIFSYAHSGGRSWSEVIGGGLALPVAGGRMLPWAARGLAGTFASGRGRTGPVVRTSLIVIAVLVVFGALLSGADAAFREFVSGLSPDVSAGSMLLHVVICAGVTLLVLAAAFLLMAPPPLRALAPPAARPAGRWGWAAPIAALDLLFLTFCALQARVLLATDKDKILRSTGLTYAEYARQGFFQLVIVTVLVLAVVAVAVRYAPKERHLVRALLGILCALTLVIVGVALRRLFLYEEALGWTRLRLWVHAFEVWLGVVVVLIAVAGIRLRAAWLPRAVAASGAAGLIALAALNPDAFIAEHNVARHQRTGKIDVGTLGGLSADAVPELDKLPEPYRSCALHGIARRLGRLDDREPVLAANLGRHRARRILAARPIDERAVCP